MLPSHSIACSRSLLCLKSLRYGLQWVQVALAVGDNELRPTLPSDTPEPLLNVALACYNPEPENRPSFALIVHHMRKVSSAGLPYVTIFSF